MKKRAGGKREDRLKICYDKRQEGVKRKRDEHREAIFPPSTLNLMFWKISRFQLLLQLLEFGIWDVDCVFLYTRHGVFVVLS